MHSIKDLRDLRDTMLQENNSDKYVCKSNGRTARYVLDMLSFYSGDPKNLQMEMNKSADLYRNTIVIDLTTDINYVLAYELLFGSVDEAPLHINDALSSIAKWRLQHP